CILFLRNESRCNIKNMKYINSKSILTTAVYLMKLKPKNIAVFLAKSPKIKSMIVSLARKNNCLMYFFLVI
ncbi:hypothetical protein OAD62_00450, partial [Oceanihabitans sp.]|nr:hypothetical protein [Oceanihabitans sp.]